MSISEFINYLYELEVVCRDIGSCKKNSKKYKEYCDKRDSIIELLIYSFKTEKLIDKKYLSE